MALLMIKLILVRTIMRRKKVNKIKKDLLERKIRK